MAYSHHPSFSPFSNCRPDLFGTSQPQLGSHDQTNEHSASKRHSKRHAWQKLTRAFSYTKTKDKAVNDTTEYPQSNVPISNQQQHFVTSEACDAWHSTAAPSIQLYSDNGSDLGWQQQHPTSVNDSMDGNIMCDYTALQADTTLRPQPDPLVRHLSNRLRNSLQLTPVDTHNSFDYLSPVASETASLNLQAGTNSPVTKRGRCNDLDDEISEDGERHIKRSRQHSPDPNYHAQQDATLFACPFSKFDPDKYSHRNTKEHDREYRNCSTGYWPTIARLKQHLYRTHDRSERCCQQCWQSFAHDSLLKKHVAAGTCEARPCPTECMTAEQRQAIRERAQCDASKQWYKIWKILFPNHPPPYSVTPEWVTGKDVLLAFQTMRTQLPQYLAACGTEHSRQYIEDAIETIYDEFAQSHGFTHFLGRSHLPNLSNEHPVQPGHDFRHESEFVYDSTNSAENQVPYHPLPKQPVPDLSYSTSINTEVSVEQHSGYSDHIDPVSIMFNNSHNHTISPQPQHVVLDFDPLGYPFPSFEMATTIRSSSSSYPQTY